MQGSPSLPHESPLAQSCQAEDPRNRHCPSMPYMQETQLPQAHPNRDLDLHQRQENPSNCCPWLGPVLQPTHSHDASDTQGVEPLPPKLLSAEGGQPHCKHHPTRWASGDTQTNLLSTIMQLEQQCQTLQHAVNPYSLQESMHAWLQPCTIVGLPSTTIQTPCQGAHMPVCCCQSQIIVAAPDAGPSLAAIADSLPPSPLQALSTLNTNPNAW